MFPNSCCFSVELFTRYNNFTVASYFNLTTNSPVFFKKSQDSLFYTGEKKKEEKSRVSAGKNQAASARWIIELFLPLSEVSKKRTLLISSEPTEMDEEKLASACVLSLYRTLTSANSHPHG